MTRTEHNLLELLQTPTLKPNGRAWVEYGNTLTVNVQTAMDYSDHPWFSETSDDGHGHPVVVFCPNVDEDTWKWLVSLSVSNDELGARWAELMRQANEL